MSKLISLVASAMSLAVLAIAFPFVVALDIAFYTAMGWHRVREYLARR